MKKFTGIARCGTCKEEVNRAEHVPEEDQSRVIMSAPFAALCKMRSHNSFSDLNYNFDLEWLEEPRPEG